MAKRLAGDPRVQLAKQAETAIVDLAKKHFGVFYKEDQKPNPNRSADAEKAAERFSSIPHGEIIRLLGEQS